MGLVKRWHWVASGRGASAACHVRMFGWRNVLVCTSVCSVSAAPGMIKSHSAMRHFVIKCSGVAQAFTLLLGISVVTIPRDTTYLSTDTETTPRQKEVYWLICFQSTVVHYCSVLELILGLTFTTLKRQTYCQCHLCLLFSGLILYSCLFFIHAGMLCIIDQGYSVNVATCCAVIWCRLYLSLRDFFDS